MRVTTTSSEPLPNSVVQLITTDPGAVPRVAVTDARGLVAFPNVSPGSVQLTASADGCVNTTKRIESSGAATVVLVLSRGYRVIANVELPANVGVQIVRVLNDTGASMDDVLDGRSDRRVEPPARLSVGPLAPGVYVIGLQGADGRRQQRVRIFDQDVLTTFR